MNRRKPRYLFYACIKYSDTNIIKLYLNNIFRKVRNTFHKFKVNMLQNSCIYFKYIDLVLSVEMALKKVKCKQNWFIILWDR